VAEFTSWIIKLNSVKACNTSIEPFLWSKIYQLMTCSILNCLYVLCGYITVYDGTQDNIGLPPPHFINNAKPKVRFQAMFLKRNF
jgi:hypothetical protein